MTNSTSRTEDCDFRQLEHEVVSNCLGQLKLNGANGGSSGSVEMKALTSLADAENARLWAAPVNALRAANMMKYVMFVERRRSVENADSIRRRTDGRQISSLRSPLRDLSLSPVRH